MSATRFSADYSCGQSPWHFVVKSGKNGKNAKFRGRALVKLGKNGKNANFRGRARLKLGKNGKNAVFWAVKEKRVSL